MFNERRRPSSSKGGFNLITLYFIPVSVRCIAGVAVVDPVDLYIVHRYFFALRDLDRH